MAALGGQNHAGRGLMRGGQDDGPGAGGGERADVDAPVVDWHRNRDDSGPPDFGRLIPVSGVLQADVPHALVGETAQDEAEALREPGTDDDLAGLSHGTTDAAEVGGEYLPQRGAAMRGTIVEVCGRDAADRLRHRPGPVAAGEAG